MLSDQLPANVGGAYASKQDALEVVQASPNRNSHIIQEGSRFYVYWSTDALERDADFFAGRSLVRELIRPDLKRRPFADIDSKLAHPDELRAAFTKVFGVDALVCDSGRGYHLVGHSGWITLAEHREGLAALAAALEAYPGIVDPVATSSLRLATSVKYVDGRPMMKYLPAGWKLRHTLCQPEDAPIDETADPLTVGRVQLDALSAEDLDVISRALAGVPDAFSQSHCPGGSAVRLTRVKTANCLICHRHHERIGAYVFPNPGLPLATVGCYAARGTSFAPLRIQLSINVEGKRPQLLGPGPTDTATPILFPTTELAGTFLTRDYVDGSPCGAGKSLALWKTIKSDDRVLVVSYRKAFSADVAAKYGLTSYASISGTIDLDQHPRLVVQIDSLPRIKSGQAPKLLVLDEIKGIARQLHGSLATASLERAAAKLEDLTRAAERVVVLDAGADDRVAEWVSTLRGREVAFRRTLPDPARAKRVVVAESHDDNFAAFRNACSMVASKPPGTMKIAAFCHFKGEPYKPSKSITCNKLYDAAICAGLRARMFTSDVGAKEREIAFSDVAKLAEDNDVLIYNLALEAGVSIEDPRFVATFCFSYQLSSVEAEFQAANRIRASKMILASFGRRPQPNWGPLHLAELQLWIKASRAGCSALKTLDLSSAEGQLFAIAKLEEYRSFAYYQARLLNLWAYNGHQVDGVDAALEVAAFQNVDSTTLPELVPTPGVKTVSAAIPGAAIDLESGGMNGGELSQPPTTVEELALHRLDYFTRVYDCAPSVLVEEPDLMEPDTFERFKRYASAIGRKAFRGSKFVTSTDTERNALVVGFMQELGLAGTSLTTGGVETRPGDQVGPPVAGAPAPAMDALYRAWSRVLSGIDRPKKRPATKRAAMGMLRTVLGAYGCTLANSNARHAARGIYTIAPYDWPARLPPAAAIPAVMAATVVAREPITPPPKLAAEPPAAPAIPAAEEYTGSVTTEYMDALLARWAMA